MAGRAGNDPFDRPVAGRLKVDFPDQPEMQVSTETIYQSLYVQSRGGLKRELTWQTSKFWALLGGECRSKFTTCAHLVRG